MHENKIYNMKKTINEHFNSIQCGSGLNDLTFTARNSVAPLLQTQQDGRRLN